MATGKADTLANSLAERIHRDTIDRNLQEGDFFMTVDQVGSHYEVSRTIAREAVSQLRALGILQSRQRTGLLVGRPDPVDLMARCIPFYGRGSEGDEVFRLLQLRYALETGAVDLAVSTAHDDQVSQLHDYSQEFDAVASVEGHSSEADRIDLAFHRLVLEMTANPLISGMHRVLSEYFHASTQLEQPPDAGKAIREHYMIADAFARRDAETARTVLRCHLESALNATPRRTVPDSIV